MCSGREILWYIIKLCEFFFYKNTYEVCSMILLVSNQHVMFINKKTTTNKYKRYNKIHKHLSYLTTVQILRTVAQTLKKKIKHKNPVLHLVAIFFIVGE